MEQDWVKMRTNKKLKENTNDIKNEKNFATKIRIIENFTRLKARVDCIFMREIDCTHSRSVKTNTFRENEPFIFYKHVIFMIFSIIMARIDKT